MPCCCFTGAQRHMGSQVPLLLDSGTSTAGQTAPVDMCSIVFSSFGIAWCFALVLNAGVYRQACRVTVVTIMHLIRLSWP